MGDVIETYPQTLPTYEAKADLGTLPEYNSENTGIASEWDDITDVVSALGRAVKLAAKSVGLTPPTQSIDGLAVHITGIDATSQLPNTSTTMGSLLNREWAANIEKIAQGGSLSGTPSATGYFGVHEGPVTIASGAFAADTILALNSAGALISFISGSTIAPIGRAIDATTAYVDLSGRVRVDGTILFFDVNGVLQCAPTAGEFDDGGEARGKDRKLGNTDAFKLELITNNVERITMLATGPIGLHVLAPTESVEISNLTTSTDGLVLKEIAAGLLAGSFMFRWEDQAGNTRGFIDHASDFVFGPAQVRGVDNFIKMFVQSGQILVQAQGNPALITLDARGGAQDSAIILLDGNGTQDWIFGRDNGTLDFTISQNASFGTNNYFVIDNTTGDITLITNTIQNRGAANLNNVFNTNAGQLRDLSFQSAGSERFIFRVNNTAEGGSDAGSDFQLQCLDDSAVVVEGNCLAIERATGHVGMGVAPTSIAAWLDVDQNVAAGAVPVLRLSQTDIDDTFINYVGTSAADGTRSISSDTTEDAAKFGAFRVEINGVTKWVRVYDDES